MAPRLPYAVARSRSTALRPCGSLSAFEKKPASIAGEHRLDFSFSLRKRYIHTYLHSNIEISYQIFPSDRKIYISAYTFREQNSSSRRTQPPRISFGHVRGPNHSVPGGGRGSATLSVFLPLSFQSTASERRGVTCLRCIRFRVNQIIDKACAIDQRFFSRKFTLLNII